MSSNKIHLKVKFDEVLERFKSIMKISSDKELSQLFDITPQNLANKKKKGTLYLDVIKFCINEKMNIDWLLTGQGRPYSVEELVGDETNFANMQLLKMTKVILESNTDYAISLSANIRSFYKAVETEKRLSDHEKRLSDLEKIKEPVETLIETEPELKKGTA